jgi:hypothetical protein
VLLYNDGSPAIASGVGEYLVRQSFADDEDTVQPVGAESLAAIRVEAARANDSDQHQLESWVRCPRGAWWSAIEWRSMTTSFFIKTVPTSTKLRSAGRTVFHGSITIDEARAVGSN